MAISNTYVLELDLKRQMTARVPRFRTGDNGILIMQVFDDGIEYNMNSVTKAELFHKTAGCNTIKSECEIITYEGKIAVKYEYEKVAMIDKGLSLLMLVLYEDDIAISVQPFTVQVYDDFVDGINSFTELIQALQKIIDELNLEIKNAIPLSQKGVPNGVATLDDDGTIPLNQLPSEVEAYFDHIEHTVWKDKVHGLQFDDDGLLMYRTNTGLQYVGFSPTGGGGGMQLLDVLITKSNGVVTLTFVGTPQSVLQKWAIGDKPKIFFATSGTNFTGNTITVTNTGLHTLYYKDSNGTEYTRLFNVDISDLPTPNITVDTEDGVVTVTIDATVAIKKWAKGDQNIGYFQSQGTVFTGNSFNVTETGWYTIYYKMTNGLEYLHKFEVTALDLPIQNIKSISETPNGTAFKFAGKKWILLDNTTGYSYCTESVYTGRFSNNPHEVNINLANNTNIGYILNTTYYNTLSQFEKDLIQTKTWTISSYIANSYPTYTVDMKIGMLTLNEWFKYTKSSNSSTQKYIDNPPTETWLLNPHSYTPDDSISYSQFIKEDGTAGALSPQYPFPSARPTIYLSPNAKVDENGEISEWLNN